MASACRARIAAVLVLAPVLAACAAREGLSRDEVFYTALGASDAVGLGALPLSNGYIYRIAAALEARIDDLDFLNLGIPGAHADAIKDAAEQSLDTVKSPDLVTIWTGANDIVSGVDPEAFERDLRELLGMLRERISAFVVIANIPDLTQLPRFAGRSHRLVTATRIRAFNAAIEQQARAFDVPIVDLFAEPIDDDLVNVIDGFHPNSAGYERIAEAFLAVILPELL